MRNIVAMVTVLMAGLALTSCGTALSVSLGNAAAYSDDLYGIHDRAALAAAEAEIAAAEAAARAENEKRIAAMVAASKAENEIDDILESIDLGGYYVDTNAVEENGGNVSIYNTIYVDNYSSAYARRLQGFSSLTYRLPSSYYDYRYGDAYFLTLAYDPAFYTVMVMGDQVWVEPRYITNMFGSWNNPYYYGYRYGYNPYYYGYSYCYYDPWGWNSPYWGCDPYYHYHHHWYSPHYGHHHAHYPNYHEPIHRPGGPGGTHGGGHSSRVEHRPSYGTSAGSTVRPGGGRLSYSDRLGGSSLSGTRTNDRGATQIAGPATGGVSSSARPGTTVTAGRPGGTPTVSPNGNRTEGRTGGELLNQDLKSSLRGTTLRGNSSTGTSNSSSRGNATTGTSTSSSRSGAKLTPTTGSSSSSSTTTRKGTTIRVGAGRSTTSTSTSSSSSSTRSKSTVKSSSSSSSSSNRSSSSSSSVRSSSSSSRSSSSGSFSSGSSTRSSGGFSGSSSSSSRGGSHR